MKRIVLYRNPGCPKCARIARIHHRFDALNRFEDTTEIPATGPLKLGEIAVEDLASARISKGVDAFRLLCRHIPAYWPLLPLLHVPAFRRYIARETGSCSDASCETADSGRRKRTP